MRSSSNALRHGDARPGHVTRLHNIWRGMLKRCNPALGNKKYAARGIAVCPEWNRYEAFKAWAMANGYEASLTIERIDNDGPYQPSNCTWVTKAEQAKNRRNSHKVTFNGKTQVIQDWARETGICQSLLSWRIRTGWPPERALTTPPGPNNRRREPEMVA